MRLSVHWTFAPFIQKPELSLTEISRLTELNKRTVYRLLAALEEKGFLSRDSDTEKYKFGFRIGNCLPICPVPMIQ